MLKSIKKYFWLFGINIFISAFTFGGGYVVIPIIEKYFVEKNKYFDKKKLLNIAAVAQSSPGAIAINLSALSGYVVGGKLGAIVSSIGAVIPPIVILSIVSVYYNSIKNNIFLEKLLMGMEIGVSSLVINMTIDMGYEIFKEKNYFYSLLIFLAFILIFFVKISTIVIILIGMILSFIYTFYKIKWRKNE
ncbi:chromate transporter [Fusobacterium sp. PH5-44]|uniref:chromate transporter n=1 Tax=unclassified Fusobacterium TaxID=2648384 RepID=UPI003D1BE8B6